MSCIPAQYTQGTTVSLPGFGLNRTVLEVDGIAVGFALFGYSYSSFLAQLTLWLGDLFVQSHSRGQGVGTALLMRLARIAKKTNCGRIEWTVAVNNSRGIAFYEKQGARIIESKLCRVNRASIAQLSGK